MSTSYWLSLFAIAGWLTLNTASAKPAEKPAFNGEPITVPQDGDAASNQNTLDINKRDQTQNLLSILKEIEAAIQNLKSEQDPKKDKRKEDREEADLNAQQDMAYWAAIMVWATGLSVLISIGGLYLIWRSLSLARQAIHAENRPWLDFKIQPASAFDRNDTDHHPEGLGLDVRFLVTNHGHSPALEVRTSIHEVKVTDETVLEDFSLDKYRMRLAKQVGKKKRPNSAVFPGKSCEIWNRILVSQQAIDDAVELLKPRGSIAEFSLKTRYVVAVYYHSATSDQIHETSAVIYLHMLHGRQCMTSLVFRKGPEFRPVRKSKIRLFNTEQIRAN